MAEEAKLNVMTEDQILESMRRRQSLRHEQKVMTCVFEYNVRDYPGNPHQVETPFGRAVSVGVGDAHAKLDAIEELIEGYDGGICDKIRAIIQRPY